MVKLTEDMVVARSRGSDIHNVKKLNCWGSELSDVSVVRKLPNVEVLSLSVNRIGTLADFQYCENLQELYIRKNNIEDINEVLYLRALPKLKSLWLADNPCTEFDQYRLTVLRALPHLQKLDNVTVDSEEVQKAMVCGIPLPSESYRGREAREMPRSSSVGESLRSEGGSSSLSDCSPPSSERRYSQTITRPSQQLNGLLQSGGGGGYDDGGDDDDDDDEYSNQTHVLDDDDEQQPITRRHTYAHYSPTGESERRISQHSNHAVSPQHFGGRKTSHRRHMHLSSSIGLNQCARMSKGNQTNGGYSNSSNGHYYNRGETDLRDRQQQEQQESYYTAQSPSRRNSQMVAEDTHHGDTRGYITPPESSSSSSYSHQQQQQQHDNEYDSRNANYLSREDTVASRRYSQEPRDHRWCEVSDQERAYSRGDGYGYASPPSEAPTSHQHHQQQQQTSPSYEQRPVSQEPRYSRGESRSVQQQYDNAYRQAEQHMDSATRAVTADRPSPTKPYPSRPKTRNANLLSAVLCLVKELDYTSLEVVEMAVRCRMEELDD